MKPKIEIQLVYLIVFDIYLSGLKVGKGWCIVSPKEETLSIVAINSENEPIESNYYDLMIINQQITTITDRVQ